MIKFDVCDQLLTCTNHPAIFSGDENLDKAGFAFDETWDGFAKTAVFTGTETYHVILDDNGVCTVPNEVLADDGEISIGVFGVSGDVVKTSSVYVYSIGKGARTTATAVPDPTPDAYAQIIKLIEDGKVAGPKGDKGDTGADGHTPERGVDYWTAADKAEILSDFPTALPNPNALTVKSGSTTVVYDGSAAKSIEITGSGVSTKYDTWTGSMFSLATGTIPAGTAANTFTDTGIRYGSIKVFRRFVFFRKSTKSQGNFSNGYGAGNDAGLRDSHAFLSVVFTHIDGYLWYYRYFATDTIPYAQPSDTVSQITNTLWAGATGYTSDCIISDGYFDIRSGNQSTFTDDNKFQILNWSALTAPVTWGLYAITTGG